MDDFKKQVMQMLADNQPRERENNDNQPPTHTSECLRVLSRAKQHKKVNVLQRFKLMEEAATHAQDAQVANESALASEPEKRDEQVKALESNRDGLRKLLMVKSLPDLVEVVNKYAKIGSSHRILRWGFKVFFFGVVDKFFSMFEADCVLISDKNAQEKAGIVSDGQEEASLPKPPPEIDPRAEGTTGINLVSMAAKRKTEFRRCAGARVAMLKEALRLAKIYRPENWNTRSKLDAHLTSLAHAIVGCENVLRAQTWENLVKEFVTYYDPTKACSNIITDKKAMKVMKLCVEAKVREFSIFKQFSAPPKGESLASSSSSSVLPMVTGQED